MQVVNLQRICLSGLGQSSHTVNVIFSMGVLIVEIQNCVFKLVKFCQIIMKNIALSMKMKV